MLVFAFCAFAIFIPASFLDFHHAAGNKRFYLPQPLYQRFSFSLQPINVCLKGIISHIAPPFIYIVSILCIFVKYF